MAEEGNTKGKSGIKKPANAGKPAGRPVKESEKAESPVGGKPSPIDEEGEAVRPVPAGSRKPKLEKGPSLFERHVNLIAAVACIAIVAVGVFVIFLPEEASVDSFWVDEPVEQGILKMIVITSSRCPGCEVGNSLEALFVTNNVQYAVNTFGEHSNDGQGLIQGLGLQKLPSYIIEEGSLKSSMVVKTKSGIAPLSDVLHFYVREGKGTYSDGIFAFPEMGLDGIIRSSVLLQEPCGDKDSMLVQFFLDPYDPNTIGRSKDIESLRSLLLEAQDVKFKFLYVYLPTYSGIMQQAYIEEYGGSPDRVRDNIDGAARYLICANDAGNQEFVEVERSLYSTYCEIDEEEVLSPDSNALWNCDKSSRFGLFLNADELEEARAKAGLSDSEEFSSCLLGVNQRMGFMLSAAEVAGIDRTPTVLVNCTYQVPLDNALGAICLLNPEMMMCKRL